MGFQNRQEEFIEGMQYVDWMPKASSIFFKEWCLINHHTFWYVHGTPIGWQLLTISLHQVTNHCGILEKSVSVRLHEQKRLE